MPEYDFFFSYSRETVEIANKLICNLEEYGIRIWYDRTDVVLGCNIRESLYSILNGVKESAWIGVIVMLDKSYFSKEWCLLELDFALRNKLKIFPILCGISKEDIPKKYAILKTINMVTIPPDNDLEYCINKILYVVIKYNEFTYRSILNSTLLECLLIAYNKALTVSFEKCICADNIAYYIETTETTRLHYNEQQLINLIHKKVKNLYKYSKLSYFDIKIICFATNKLLNIFRIKNPL